MKHGAARPVCLLFVGFPKRIDSLPLAHQNASYQRHFDCGHAVGFPQRKDVQEDGDFTWNV
jgi:hypothetical protein